MNATNLESPPQAPKPFTLTPEDYRIIQECNKESFFQRCLPFSTILGGLTYLATKSGYLRPHVTWGAAPKVMVAVFAGYIAGKISYQQACQEKLMASPNSPLGAALRAKKQQGGGGFQDSLTLDMPGYSLPAFIEEKPADVYQDDLTTRTFTDLDTYRPLNQGLGDSYQYNLDSPQRPEDFVLPPQAPTPNSYEEMRRKNREEFEKKSRSTFRPSDQYQPQPVQPSSRPGNEPFDHYKPTNVYGDIFEK